MDEASTLPSNFTALSMFGGMRAQPRGLHQLRQVALDNRHTCRHLLQQGGVALAQLQMVEVFLYKCSAWEAQQMLQECALVQVSRARDCALWVVSQVMSLAMSVSMAGCCTSNCSDCLSFMTSASKASACRMPHG